MGTWDAGVYQNDHALDLLSIEVASLVESIEETLAIEDLAFDDIEGPLIYVHLLGRIANEASVDISRSQVAGWKATYLTAFDDTIGDRTAYVKKRRAVIVKTFDALTKRLDDDDDDDDEPPVAKKKRKKPAKRSKAKN